MVWSCGWLEEVDGVELLVVGRGLVKDLVDCGWLEKFY